jgi:hypothetical protein
MERRTGRQTDLKKPIIAKTPKQYIVILARKDWPSEGLSRESSIKSCVIKVRIWCADLSIFNRLKHISTNTLLH